MADVFISYSRDDNAKAGQIARGLEAMGLTCFWDTEIPPGQTWADYIEGKLSQCKAVIVLWSANSVGSQWVREEARMGRERARLIPVLLDGAQPPFGFGEVQAADLSTWNGEANHAGWQRFSQAVAALAGGAQQSQTAAAQSPQGAWRGQTGSAAAGALVGNLSPIEYVKKCLRLYVDGKGRARRAEYWWWILFTFAVGIVTYIIDVVLFGFNSYTSAPNNQIVSSIASLALLAPGVSVMSRRFHDVGLNGWLVAGVFGGLFAGAMLGAIPGTAMLGGLLILVVGVGALAVALIPSRPGPNQYGPNPKGI